MLVKICGLTQPDEVAEVARAGADLVGFVLATGPRQVNWGQLEELVAAIPPATARAVAVLVDPEPDHIEAAFSAGVSLVQLHGQESPAFCRPWEARLIKAIRVASPADLERARAYSSCAALLLDSERPGSGQSWDWSYLSGFELPYFLAGGLRPENLAGAWQLLRPYGFDASSALEKRPGRKDLDRVRAFINTARQCA